MYLENITVLSGRLRLIEINSLGCFPGSQVGKKQPTLRNHQRYNYRYLKPKCPPVLIGKGIVLQGWSPKIEDIHRFQAFIYPTCLETSLDEVWAAKNQPYLGLHVFHCRCSNGHALSGKFPHRQNSKSLAFGVCFHEEISLKSIFLHCKYVLSVYLKTGLQRTWVPCSSLFEPPTSSAAIAPSIAATTIRLLQCKKLSVLSFGLAHHQLQPFAALFQPAQTHQDPHWPFFWPVCCKALLSNTNHILMQSTVGFVFLAASSSSHPEDGNIASDSDRSRVYLPITLSPYPTIHIRVAVSKLFVSSCTSLSDPQTLHTKKHVVQQKGMFSI